MHKLTIAVAALAAALTFAPSALSHLPQSARVLRQARIEQHPLPAPTQLRLSRQTILYANRVLRFLRTHPRAGTYRARQRVGHNHLWLRHFGAVERDKARTRLVAIRAAAALPAHYRGWLCIHLGPSFNNTGHHEGTSTSGTYTGPLQMTNPWMGVRGSWGYMREVDVYRIAEQVAARYGFAYSFMASQWPNTFPGCSAYF